MTGLHGCGKPGKRSDAALHSSRPAGSFRATPPPRLLHHDPGRGPAGRPQCRQPEARSARRRPVRFTCEHFWPSTMRCVCRAAASPSSIYRG